MFRREIQKSHQFQLEKALSICNQLGKWIASEYHNTFIKSAMGKAMVYYLTRWKHLISYLPDGGLKIDNKSVENAIRPAALDRKNPLFAGSHIFFCVREHIVFSENIKKRVSTNFEAWRCQNHLSRIFLVSQGPLWEGTCVFTVRSE